MENLASIPKYYETFIPILKVLSNKQTISTGELKTIVRDTFYKDLPVELLNFPTKNGGPLILNRIGWGKAYLKQGGYIKQPARALVEITDKGLSVLNKGELSLKELLKDYDFLAYKKATEKVGVIAEDVSMSESTPQDLIDSGFRVIENQIKTDLLERIKLINPYYFEKVVLMLFQKMGYGDFKETPKSRDGGIDGIIYQDQLGLDKIYIQVKRYTDNNVHLKEMTNFIGAISRDAQKGIFVTTSDFDKNSLEKARNAQQTIRCINGGELVELMIKYNLGVQVKNTYEVKEIDDDFFEED